MIRTNRRSNQRRERRNTMRNKKSKRKYGRRTFGMRRKNFRTSSTIGGAVRALTGRRGLPLSNGSYSPSSQPDSHRSRFSDHHPRVGSSLFRGLFCWDSGLRIFSIYAKSNCCSHSTNTFWAIFPLVYLQVCPSKPLSQNLSSRLRSNSENITGSSALFSD